MDNGLKSENRTHLFSIQSSSHSVFSYQMKTVAEKVAPSVFCQSMQSIMYVTPLPCGLIKIFVMIPMGRDISEIRLTSSIP